MTRDRPIHELIVAPPANSSAELKGKSIAVGSLDGTAAIMTRRILQAKGLDGQKDVNLLSMDTPARLQSLFSGRVAGAMITPPAIYLAEEKGYKVFGRGRDYMRYLQTGVVSTDSPYQTETRKTGAIPESVEPRAQGISGEFRNHDSLYSKTPGHQRRSTGAAHV